MEFEFPFATLALVSACVGVTSHLAWFIHGEHHRLAAQYFVTAIVGPPIATALLSYYFELPIIKSILVIAVTFGSLISGLFLSIGLYRRFFHSLCKFPGPPQARWTQLWHISKVMSKLDNFRHLDRLHAQYGEYVRVGPNLLSVADPDWVERIHRPQTKFIKSDWYESDYPTVTLHQMRDKAMHDARRRHGWDKAFTTKSLRSYDSRLIKYANQLRDQIRKRSGQVVNATKWFDYLTFDVMGDLAFGRNFQALEKGESHFYIDTLHMGFRLPGLVGSAPWIVQIFLLIKLSWTPFGQLLLYSEKCVEERKTRTLKEPDVMSHILEAGDFFPNSKERERLLLVGDARLLIVAGSDTSSSALLYCFYHLAKDPSLVEKLRAELKEHNMSISSISRVSNDDNGDDDSSNNNNNNKNNKTFEVTSLQYLPYLNALINETLRMHPPVPSGVYRNTPQEGVVINGIHLPGGVKVIGPMHTIHRSPRAFVQPNEFIPERWTTRPELILNKNAFFPFSMGKFACIGKMLALNEIRTVISKMVLEFDIEFAPGEDGSKLLNESLDTFTMSNAPLMVVWKKRDHSTNNNQDDDDDDDNSKSN